MIYQPPYTSCFVFCIFLFFFFFLFINLVSVLFFLSRRRYHDLNFADYGEFEILEAAVHIL